MAARNLLHYNKLETFKHWLEIRGVPTRPGNGEYEVLQVWQDPHWIPIFRRTKGDHLTVQGRMVALVEQFLQDKRNDQNPSPCKRKVFVHRYKDSHEAKRRKLKRALADGQIILIHEERDGWLYGVPDDFHVPGDDPRANRNPHPTHQRACPPQVQPEGGGSENPPW